MCQKNKSKTCGNDGHCKFFIFNCDLSHLFQLTTACDYRLMREDAGMENAICYCIHMTMQYLSSYFLSNSQAQQQTSPRYTSNEHDHNSCYIKYTKYNHLFEPKYQGHSSARNFFWQSLYTFRYIQSGSTWTQAFLGGRVLGV